jgi:hypothetical protein
MEYKQDFSVYQFPWWSGARDTIKDIENADKMDELQDHLEEVFADGELPTDTNINDYVWHDRAMVYAALGLDENGELPQDVDEEEEEDEEEDGAE